TMQMITDRIASTSVTISGQRIPVVANTISIAIEITARMITREPSRLLPVPLMLIPNTVAHGPTAPMIITTVAATAAQSSGGRSYRSADGVDGTEAKCEVHCEPSQ